MHSHLCSPKENIKDFEANFQYELLLVEAVTNVDVFSALSIFNELVNCSYHLNSCGCKTRAFKNQLISICCLLCHEVVKKGVSTYNAKAKNQAFVSLVEECSSVSELKKVGEKIIRSYSMQVTGSLTSSKDVYVSKALGHIHSN